MKEEVPPHPPNLQKKKDDAYGIDPAAAEELAEKMEDLGRELEAEKRSCHAVSKRLEEKESALLSLHTDLQKAEAKSSDSGAAMAELKAQLDQYKKDNLDMQGKISNLASELALAEEKQKKSGVCVLI